MTLGYLKEFLENFIHVRLPIGGTYFRGIASLNKKVKEKRCFIEIINKDELWLARAIMTGKARFCDDPNYQMIRKDNHSLQTSLAEDLHEKAGVPKAKYGIEEIKKFQNVLLPHFHLVVFSSVYFDRVIFKGLPAEKQINVYHYNEHFAPITTMTGFLERSYYCIHCNKGYQNDKTHICDKTCACCKSNKCCTIDKWKNCDKCKRIFKSPSCLDNHLEPNKVGKSVCDFFIKCDTCKKVYD
jgi:hypothetical protein